MENVEVDFLAYVEEKVKDAEAREQVAYELFTKAKAEWERVVLVGNKLRLIRDHIDDLVKGHFEEAPL